ncbi:hypothetical protein HDU76_002395 [Blyttiomyces sp. JEL0837]|nr:hypothetical protein HDU76_002395 [Blyttiomyces sp. JEL0837]
MITVNNPEYHLKDTVAVICGYGPGISHAVAVKFGSMGHKLALVARTKSKLDDAVKAFVELGITAQAFPQDLTKADEMKSLIENIHDTFGTISLIHWNPYAGPTGPLLSETPESLTTAFTLSTISPIMIFQAAFSDLQQTKGSMLLTGGGLGLETDNHMMAKVALMRNTGSLAISKAAMRKTTELLHFKALEFGGFVGEVTVMGIVRGSNGDVDGSAKITSDAVAEVFWGLHEKRDQVWINFAG